jgi:hypothetical protein
MSEQGLESRDDTFDHFRQLEECWNDRLTFENLRLPERYCKGELRLLIYIRIAVSGKDPVDLCAVLQRERTLCEGRPGRLDSVDYWLPHVGKHGSEVQGDIGVGARDRKQEPVFVDVVKLIEYPEHIIPTVILESGAFDCSSEAADALLTGI